MLDSPKNKQPKKLNTKTLSTTTKNRGVCILHCMWKFIECWVEETTEKN